MGADRLTPGARRLRKQKTDAEERLWSRLRHRQLDGRRFNSQFVIGGAVVDFVCRAAKLVLDGGQHAVQAEQDAERTRIIEAHGYTVIRYWNNDVIDNLDGVLEDIRRHLRLILDE